MADADGVPPLRVWFYTLLILVVLCAVGVAAFLLLDDPLAYLALELRSGTRPAALTIAG
jgi:hypothetical protein